ncbi:hypothetical protein [Pseudomonas sp. Marseille-Q5115]|uniref:hypothetical protein n=1 Tax=Pseudomonas sp. Marseille-Q5115 TaxID=2866593 RepID=UPI001CE42983|nr:hypothetical protein [Pseudomonas sp. Marseille-Q5115]
MRTSLAICSLAALGALTGCASAPNEPTLALQTSKSPDAYAACVMPRLQEHAFHPTLTQGQRNYRIVVPSSIAADNVIDAYKAGEGGKVFVYERSLLSPGFARVARECA